MDINIPPILIPSKNKEIYENLKEVIKKFDKKSLEELLKEGIVKVHRETKTGKKGDPKGEKTITIKIKIGGEETGG